MASSSLEEEELWLYGDPLKPDVLHESSSGLAGESNELQGISPVSETGSQDKEELKLVTQTYSNEEDSESDSDDDIMVTIGDIHTGAPSCMGSSSIQNIKSGRGYNSSGRGIDFSAPGCINGLPVLEVDLDLFEEKPWRKPGADISDYFNYGFNEATWKVYCEKQKRLQLGLDTASPSLNKENKIKVQQGRIGHSEKGVENGYENADLKSNTVAYGDQNLSETSPNRKFGGMIDVASGLVCNISRVEGRRWDNHTTEENVIQCRPSASLLTLPHHQRSAPPLPDAERDTESLAAYVIGDHGYKPHPIIQQHRLHPPPLLPPPNIAPSPSNPPLFPAPPPHFFQRPPPNTMPPPSLHPPALLPPPLIPPPSVHMPSLNGTPNAYNSRPPPQHSFNPAGDSGFRNYTPVSTPHTSWVTTSDKGTSSRESNSWTPRRMRIQERVRIRSPTPTEYIEDDHYLNYSREKNYSYERRHRRSHESSWEQEDRSRGEQRQRERGESNKSKSSRRKQESEERESHRRHKRKKSKRCKEEKDTCEEIMTGVKKRDVRE